MQSESHAGAVAGIRAYLRTLVKRFRSSGSLVYQLSIIGLILFITGMPLAFFIWGSFWTTAPGMGGGFTLRGYRQVATSSGVHRTVVNTLGVAFLSVSLALALGISAMLFIIKSTIPGKGILSFIILIQYLLPSHVLALAWEFYAGPGGPVNQALDLLPFVGPSAFNLFSVEGIGIVVGVHYAGLVFLLTSGAMKAIPLSLEETAEVAGASTAATMRKVVLPLVFPSLAISTVIVFTRALNSFGAPLILGLRHQVFVLATLIFQSLSAYPFDFTFASALGALLLVLSMSGLVLQRRLTGARDKYETLTGGGGGMGSKQYDFGKPLYALFYLVILVLYVLPLFAIVLSSFQQAYLGFNIAEAEWTLDNYVALLTGSRGNEFWQVMYNTLVVSGLGAFIGMVVAVLASYVIVKVDGRLSTLLDYLTLTPLSIPGIVIGTAYLWLILSFDPLGLYGTLLIIIVPLVGTFIVYGTRATNSSFRAIGQELEDASYVSGAGLVGTMRRVFAPLVMPGFISGYIILFVDFMKVITIPLLLAGSGNEVIQVMLWRMIQLGELQRSAALAMIIVLLVAIVYALAHTLTDVDLTSI